jgi:hypothetical protein
VYRERTYICPVDLGDLEHETAECRQFALRALSLGGIGRISFVRRGGPCEPMVPEPDEALLVHESHGMFGKPAEERYGRNVEQCTTAQAIYDEEPQHA